jgi:hypothetical protein
MGVGTEAPTIKNVMMNTSDGIRSGFLRTKLVFRFPARTLLHTARSITIIVTNNPYDPRISKESSAAPITYFLHDSFELSNSVIALYGRI